MDQCPPSVTVPIATTSAGPVSRNNRTAIDKSMAFMIDKIISGTVIFQDGIFKIAAALRIVLPGHTVIAGMGSELFAIPMRHDEFLSMLPDPSTGRRAAAGAVVDICEAILIYPLHGPALLYRLMLPV